MNHPRIIDWTRAIVCYARCEPCQFGQCPGGEHSWAGFEDVEHALATGQKDPTNDRCACECVTNGPLPTEPDWDDEPLSMDPCPVCGEPTACAYDSEGRPLLHALTDEDGETR